MNYKKKILISKYKYVNSMLSKYYFTFIYKVRSIFIINVHLWLITKEIKSIIGFVPSLNLHKGKREGKKFDTLHKILLQGFG